MEFMSYSNFFQEVFAVQPNFTNWDMFYGDKIFYIFGHINKLLMCHYSIQKRMSEQKNQLTAQDLHQNRKDTLSLEEVPSQQEAFSNCKVASNRVVAFNVNQASDISMTHPMQSPPSITMSFFLKTLGLVFLLNMPILCYLFGPALSSDLTCIFLVTNSYSLARKSISSFLDTNDCDFVIIGTHGNFGVETSYMSGLNNENVIEVVERNQYSLEFVDYLVSMVSTEFYFLAETQYYYTGNDFVQFSMKAMKKDYQIGQVLAVGAHGKTEQDIKKLGFSWKPGVHRKSDYPENGFTYGLKFYQQKYQYRSEKKLSNYFRSRGKYLATNHTDLKIDDVRTPRKGFIKKISKRQKNSKTISLSNPFKIQQIWSKQNNYVTFNPNFSTVSPPAPGIYKSYYTQNMQRNVGQHLLFLKSCMSKPVSIFEIHQLTTLTNLPICTIVLPSENCTEQQIVDSINIQNYSDVMVVTGINQNKNYNGTLNYFHYFSVIEKECQENAFVMFLTTPLKLGALNLINEQLQKNRAWIVGYIFHIKIVI